MSILENNPPEITPAQRSAKILIRSAKSLFDQMVSTFNSGTSTFWNNNSATPSEIADVLGDDAKELFELHYKLSLLISEIKPEAISESLPLVGNFTMNEDGTVTINS